MKRFNLRFLVILGMSCLLFSAALFTRSTSAQSGVFTPMQLSNVTATTASRISNPVISPDGTLVAYMVETVSNSNDGHLFVVNTNGSGATEIAAGVKLDFGQSLSWGGNKVAFVACDGCTPSLGGDVYVTNSDGTGLIKLSTGSHIDRSPRISADGSTVAYIQHNLISGSWVSSRFSWLKPMA